MPNANVQQQQTYLDLPRHRRRRQHLLQRVLVGRGSGCEHDLRLVVQQRLDLFPLRLCRAGWVGRVGGWGLREGTLWAWPSSSNSDLDVQRCLDLLALRRCRKGGRGRKPGDQVVNPGPTPAHKITNQPGRRQKHSCPNLISKRKIDLTCFEVLLELLLGEPRPSDDQAAHHLPVYMPHHRLGDKGGGLVWLGLVGLGGGVFKQSVCVCMHVCMPAQRAIPLPGGRGRVYQRSKHQ